MSPLFLGCLPGDDQTRRNGTLTLARSAGTMYTPAHPGRDFQFTDYAPEVFRDLRDHHGIDSADYLISLTGDYVLSEIVSPGKSGSFFYFSHDTKYMLKTITSSEKRFFKRILRSYHQVGEMSFLIQRCISGVLTHQALSHSM